MALSIKETEHLARMLEERLRRVGPDTRKAVLLKDLAAICRRLSALPILNDRSADEMICYDENGLPTGDPVLYKGDDFARTDSQRAGGS